MQDATQRDFVAFYMSGSALLAGQGMRLYDAGVQTQIEQDAVTPYPAVFVPNVYPPWDAVACVPLALLSYGTAYWVWVLLNLGMTACAIRWLLSLFAPQRAEGTLLCLAAICFAPIFHATWQGQASLLALLGLAGGVVLLRRRADWAAALCLLLVLVKPQLVLLAGAALVIWPRRRAIAVFATGAILLVGLSLLFFGNWIADSVRLLATMLDVEARNGYTLGMTNWRGLIYVLIGNNTSLLAQGLEALLIVVSLAIAGLLCWPWARWGPGTADMRFGIAAILLLMVGPHLYIHDSTALLVPGFLLWNATRSAAGSAMDVRRLRWLLALGPVVFYTLQFWHPPLVQIGAWYLVLLVAVALPSIFRSVAGPSSAQRPIDAEGGAMV